MQNSKEEVNTYILDEYLKSRGDKMKISGCYTTTTNCSKILKDIVACQAHPALVKQVQCLPVFLNFK